MNLLKITFLVFVAASLALLLSNQATALDHPWDDRPTDTTSASSNNVDNNDGHPTVGDDDDAETIKDKIVSSMRFWYNWLTGGIDAYLITQKVQQAESKPERGKTHATGKVHKTNFR